MGNHIHLNMSQSSENSSPYSSFLGRWHILNDGGGSASTCILELQQLNKAFPNSTQVIRQWSTDKVSVLLMLFPLHFQSICSKCASSNPSLDFCSIFSCLLFYRSVFTTLSVRGSLLYEGWESVPLSLSWCDVFLAFHFYPAAPLLLPIVLSPFTTYDIPSISAVSHPFSFRIKWLLGHHPGTSRRK